MQTFKEYLDLYDFDRNERTGEVIIEAMRVTWDRALLEAARTVVTVKDPDEAYREIHKALSR